VETGVDRCLVRTARPVTGEKAPFAQPIEAGVGEAQISTLSSVDPAAVSAVRSIIDDERAHRDRAGFESTAGFFWPRVLRPVVSWATEPVIWLGMRL
jgi:demethoxyubiquinone hydroxylase (CLK1/Coq7/Cat5 family)